MAGRKTVADRLAEALGAVLGTSELPVRLRGWDGSIAGPAGAPVVAVRSR
ncbi:SAM-dependent methyltransferase, partial [Modestobacter versicolor]